MADEQAKQMPPTANSPTPWEDLPDAEKIERLRMVLKGQGNTLADLNQKAAILSSHRHGQDGEVLIPIHGGLSGGPMGGLAGGKEDRPWI